MGDIENINDVRNALDGIERAYFVPTFPNVLFQGETFATAVDELGTKHVVIVTQMKNFLLNKHSRGFNGPTGIKSKSRSLAV